MTAARWRALMRAFGFAGNGDTFHALRAAYAEAHRHYHTGEHVGECLDLLDACAAEAERPHEIELALWFHDAVYRPLSGDNERRSAEWAARFLTSNEADRGVVERMRDLILATRHSAPPTGKDASLLLDIDLAILGADDVRFDAFEVAVRREYRLVPGFLYRNERHRVLAGFLRRPRIYLNEAFYAEREQRARANLARAMAQLSGADDVL